jgi:hypothetical protein
MTIYFPLSQESLKSRLTGLRGSSYKYLWEDPAFVPAIINSIILIGAVLVMPWS